MPAAEDDIWNLIRAQLRAAVTDATFHLWLEPLTLESREGDVLCVGAPDSTRSWVADRFARVLQTCAAAIVGPAATVAVVPLRSGGGGRPAGPSAPAACAEPGGPRAQELNPKYTFEQFVIGEENRLAHAAALAVAELPGQTYNPLFIYGSPGLGKTHLLHAIGNYLAEHEPSRVVRYATVETFTNHFLRAISDKTTSPFKDHYREADVLLVDDVQFLERKARTEEEFFHTWNELYESGAQVVVTSDRLPRDLQGVEDRLRERFESGLVTDVAPPGHAARMTILRKRAAQDRLTLPDESALGVIAERMADNVRALEGALIRTVAYASMRGLVLDGEVAAHVLDELYGAARPGRRSVADVQAAAAQVFGVTEEELRGASRVARLAWPRQVAMYLARELTDASLPSIGRAFGDRNHTTVMHACKRAGERIARDRGASADVERVAKRLGGAGAVRAG